MDRPLRLVGQKIPNLRGVPRRSVVIQSLRTMAVLCNAQCVVSFAAVCVVRVTMEPTLLCPSSHASCRLLRRCAAGHASSL